MPERKPQFYDAYVFRDIGANNKAYFNPWPHMRDGDWTMVEPHLIASTMRLAYRWAQGTSIKYSRKKGTYDDPIYGTVPVYYITCRDPNGECLMQQIRTLPRKRVLRVSGEEATRIQAVVDHLHAEGAGPFELQKREGHYAVARMLYPPENWQEKWRAAMEARNGN